MCNFSELLIKVNVPEIKLNDENCIFKHYKNFCYYDEKIIPSRPFLWVRKNVVLEMNAF